MQPRLMNIEKIKIEENRFSSAEDIEDKLRNLPEMRFDSSGELRAYMDPSKVIHIEPVKGERILGIEINGIYISHTNGNGCLPFSYQKQKFELYYRPIDNS